MFEEVKRNLLEFLLNKKIPLQISYLSPEVFLYTFFNSPMKEILKDAYAKKYIELELQQSEKQKDAKRIRVANYTENDVEEYEVTSMNSHKNISKLGVEFLSYKDVKCQIPNAKNMLKETTPQSIFDQMHKKLFSEFGDSYTLIPYRRA